LTAIIEVWKRAIETCQNHQYVCCFGGSVLELFSGLGLTVRNETGICAHLQHSDATASS